MTGKSRSVFGALLLAAIAFALGLSAAPQLHDRLHHGNSALHECAATLFSAGSVEHSDCEPAPVAPLLVPVRPSLPVADWPQVVVRFSASLLEHAPPA